ncbi:GNAT family N-acetyltransferase [Roseicella aquatilis]|uniref:GNAT family N-acetyltransferase n=1 Tax=Roseicella aquatilis TaxID=2527868 RepID=A0A4R4DSI5_9PROT|nr:GNAT family N-acetyltransferase [Roseicella aquatilis]TCZ64325.1 GNAT family N-acetyltransferase [Roseicella aquatilis]
MSIRPARPEEAPLLAALVERAYAPWVPMIGRRPAPMDDDYAARIEAGEAWVLEEAGAARGVVVIEQHADHLMLDNIAVDPARQGTGEGRILLDFVEAEARRRGLPEVRLYTNALMERNIALYARRGYAETERRQEKGFARVFMAKRLG